MRELLFAIFLGMFFLACNHDTSMDEDPKELFEQQNHGGIQYKEGNYWIDVDKQEIDVTDSLDNFTIAFKVQYGMSKVEIETTTPGCKATLLDSLTHQYQPGSIFDMPPFDDFYTDCVKQRVAFETNGADDITFKLYRDPHLRPSVTAKLTRKKSK